MPSNTRLPDPVIEMIKAADTVFIATLYTSTPSTASKFPSHAGMNARGGLPGFIRVRPSDGRTIVLPDYSGNRFMSSLGNIEVNGVAGFTIVDFESGDVLYLTGKARNLIGDEAREVMSRHASVTVLETTGYTLVAGALPVRQRPGSRIGRSPYSPKVRYLVEEAESELGGSIAHKAQLESAVQLSDDLAIFRFKVIPKPGAAPLHIRPGQAIVLDFMDWLGPPAYSHMADSAPGSINDDRVRTWTVSSSHEDGDITWFELTMREMKGGTVTGALFDILREQAGGKTGGQVAIDIARPVVVDVVGVSGEFTIGEGKIDALWVAGGIGITPFLAMLNALARREKVSGDIKLALSTREPDIMLGLMRDSLQRLSKTIRVAIALFTRSPVNVSLSELQGPNQQITVREGRIGPDYWPTISRGKDVLICGPNEFGDAAVEGLQAAGIPNEKIQREGFY
jgi:NAD(P)H-flavin reductase